MKFTIKFHQHTFFPGEEVWLPVALTGISALTLQKMAETGCFEVRDGAVRAENLHDVLRVIRLRRHLGVNLAGAAVILAMLDRLEKLERENEQLRRRLGY